MRNMLIKNVKNAKSLIEGKSGKQEKFVPLATSAFLCQTHWLNIKAKRIKIFQIEKKVIFVFFVQSCARHLFTQIYIHLGGYLRLSEIPHIEDALKYNMKGWKLLHV